MREFLCRYVFHNWKHVEGDINRYYECKECNKRKVKVDLNIYQPIDHNWLEKTNEIT